MLRLLALALGLIASISFARTPAQPGRPALSDMDIHHVLAERIDRQRGGVGLVAGLVTPAGQRVIGHGSVSNRITRRVDGDTLFEIASVTKVFTTLLLADMVQRGEVGLDDPIAKFLPAGMKLPERGGRAITLRDLATHTSGLPRMPTNFAPSDPGNPYADYSVERLYRFLSGYELTRDIGAQYEYSNLGMGLLGHVLARRAGMDYERLVVSRVAAPLRLNATRMSLSPELKARLAVGHDERLEPVANWDDLTLAGAGSLFSSANDLLAFLAATFQQESPLTAAMAATLAVRRPTGFPDLEIGLGWHVSKRAGREVIWHNGGTAGYASYLAYVPHAQLGLAVLANSGHGVDDLALELIDRFAP
jgi:CubicO group peptidase (beta-lactamase class C family)